jgi:hypothetical protein
MRFEAGITIKATPGAIWEAVSDPETWPRWTEAVHRVKKLSEGPLGVGTRFRITIMCIVPVWLRMTVTEFLPGERVAMEGKALLGRTTRYYELRPLIGGTRAVAGGEARGPLAPLAWLVGQVLSNEIVQALKIKMEG